MALTLEPSTRVMWCDVLGCDNFEKREGKPAMWLEALESRIQDPTNKEWEKQNVELQIWYPTTNDELCHAALSKMYSLHSKSVKISWLHSQI